MTRDKGDTPLRNKLIAEFVGTFLLVLLAVGSSSPAASANGTVGVAIGFGVVLAAWAYALGPTSGCPSTRP